MDGPSMILLLLANKAVNEPKDAKTAWEGVAEGLEDAEEEYLLGPVMDLSRYGVFGCGPTATTGAAARPQPQDPGNCSRPQLQAL